MVNWSQGFGTSLAQGPVSQLIVNNPNDNIIKQICTAHFGQWRH